MGVRAGPGHPHRDGEKLGMLRSPGVTDGGFGADPFRNTAAAYVPSQDPGELVGMRAGPTHTGEYTLTRADGARSTAVVGKIVTVSGSVTITPADGSALQASLGDLVYQGDVVETGADGAAGIAFADGTTSNLSASGRMVLSEFLFDPNGTSNSTLISVVQGTFAYLAGKVAKTGDMKIDTPVGTVRIGRTGPSGGIGILTVAALTLYGIKDIHAMGGDAVFLEDGTIGNSDQDKNP